MFDYKLFAKNIVSQSKDLIPVEFSDKEKEYISTTVGNFVELAGESLNNDKENDFSDEQKVFITQVIAEWTFHKSVDLIRAEIPSIYWDGVMQKIAFTIFEVIKQAILKDIPQEQVLEAVEHQVKKVYKECIKELPIDDEQKDIAKEQSNIDKMATEAKENNKFSWKDFLDKGIHILVLFLIGFATSLLSFLLYSTPKINYSWYLCLTIVIIIVTYIGYYIKHKLDIKKEEKKLENVRQQMQDLVNPDRMFDRLGVDIICLQVGQGLLCIADPDQEGLLLAKLAALRQRLTDNLGYIIPNARIIDSNELQEYEYSISIRNNVVDTGFVYPNKYMIIADTWEATGKAVPEDVIIADDPIYKVKAYWVDADIAIEKKDMHAIAPDDVIIQHLEEVLIQQVDKVLSEKEIRKCIDLVKEDNSVSTDSLLTKLSYGDIRRIFVNLIQEKVSIKDIVLILSRLEDYSRFNKESDILSERLRKDLSRQICLVNCNRDKKIFALGFSPELLENLTNKVEKQTGFNKTQLNLDFDEMKNLVETTANKLMKAHQKIGQQPIILVNDELRLPLYRLLVKHIPTIVVLSISEIEQDIKLEIVDTIK